MKVRQVQDLFTQREIEWAAEHVDKPHYVAEKIVKPVISRIDTQTEQPNDPLYIAYLLIYAIQHQGNKYIEKAKHEKSE